MLLDVKIMDLGITHFGIIKLEAGSETTESGSTIFF
jgi:hypothetical protein